MSDLTKQSELKNCPFCDSTNVDPEGWASTDRSGPACDDCGATADTVEIWNTRPASAASSTLTPVKQVHKLRHLLNFMPDKDFHLPREEARELLRYIDALRSTSSAGVREADVIEVEGFEGTPDALADHLSLLDRALANAALFLNLGAGFAPDTAINEKFCNGERLKTRGLASVMREIAKTCSALSDHGVQKSAEEANTKSDGGDDR